MRATIKGLVTAAVLVGAVLPASVQAQPATGGVQERLRQIEQEKREDLSSRAGSDTYLKQTGENRRLEAFGGWQTFTYLDFSDDDRNSQTLDLLKSLSIKDTRLWYSGKYGQKWGTYVRARLQDYAFQVAPGVTKPDFNILQPLDLDLGYVEYRPSAEYRVRVGRQFLTLGRGIAMSDILDVAQFYRSAKGLTIQAFYGTTPNRQLNIDSSIPGFNLGLTHRNFGAVEASYLHKSGNRYYGYYLNQNDQSQTTSATVAATDFRYNSQYVGLGANLRLSARVGAIVEGILQDGSTLASLATPLRIPIDASAFDALVFWSPKGANQPLVQGEYAFGSGDRDRASVTNTVGGKTTATTDQNFLYFGRLETGVALSPRLSNMHMVRLGYQQRLRLKGRPIELTDPILGMKLSTYYKEHQSGAISDTLATNVTSDHIGDAIDFYTAWRVASDISFNFQYGYFEPGAAYPVGTQSSSDRFIVSTTFSF